MKVRKMLLRAAIVGGLVVGMAAPTSGMAAEAPAKIQPNDNFSQFGRMGSFMGQYFQGNMHEIIAEKLGMTTDELYKARLDGKPIAELLKEKKLDAADVVKAVMADREVALNEMVKAKTITKDQKDAMLKNMKAMVEAMINAEGVGPRGKGAGIYKGSPCPMMPSGQPGMGQGRMGTGPMWW